MSTLTTHRKAERFARLVDLDVPPLFLDGGDPSMRPAVTLTTALRSAGRTTAPTPLSADARLEMRQRLVAAANVQAASLTMPEVASRAKAARHRLSRRASALVGSIVIVTSVSGVGVAAARSLPGSPFYDIKRATESVQLWLASGAHAKGEQHLGFARARLAEARALGADSPYAVSTLRSMNRETREGSTDLIDAYRSSGENAPLADLVRFMRQQYAELVRFGNVAGDRLRAQTFYSLTLLTGVAQEVQSVSGTTCLTCIVTGSNPHSTPAPGGSASPNPATSGSTPGSSPSTSGSPSHPGPRPTDLLPTGLVPTRLPTKLPTLPPLINQHNGTTHKGGSVVPTLSPLPLISGITHLLSGI